MLAMPINLKSVGNWALKCWDLLSLSQLRFSDFGKMSWPGAPAPEYL